MDILNPSINWKIFVDKSEKVFEALDLLENTAYLVLVKSTSQNPTHEAVLFTGFKNGNYCEIYNNSYDKPLKMMDIYSIKILKKLHTFK